MMEAPTSYARIRMLVQPVTYLGLAMLAFLWAAVFLLVHKDKTAAYDNALRDGVAA